MRARLTASTNLEIETGDAWPCVVEWQVVEYDDAAVTTGDVSFAVGDFVKPVPIPSTDTTKSWLLFNYWSQSGTVADIGQKLVHGEL